MSLFDRLAAADGVDPDSDAPRAEVRQLSTGEIKLTERDAPDAWLASSEWCDLTGWR